MQSLKYKEVLKVEVLDGLMTTVATSNNPVSLVIAGVKLIIFFCYLRVRIQMISLEMLIKKQEAEIKNEQNDQDAADTVLN